MKKNTMKTALFVALLSLVGYNAKAQNKELKVGNNPTIKQPSAVLEVDSNNKGMLLPRVALTGITDAVTIPSPANSLTIFNTATVGTAPNNITPGYYYWSATSNRWIRLIDREADVRAVDTRSHITQDAGVNGSEGTSSGGSNNILLGAGAGNAGNSNIALGSAALDDVTQSYNVGIGNSALRAITASTGNIGIGFQAGNTLTDGNNSIFIGHNVKPNVSTTASNQLNIGNWIYGNAGLIGLGTDASNPTQRLDVANGNLRVRDINLPASAGTLADKIVVANGTGVFRTVDRSTFDADLRLVGANNHITQDAGTGANGTSAGTGGHNIMMGFQAGNALTTGSNNIGIGRLALQNITTASDNTAVGSQALRVNTGINNTAFGAETLSSNTTGVRNTALGVRSLTTNTTGNDNTALGSAALRLNTTGSSNVAIGRNTLETNTTGIENLGMGNFALTANSTGNYNVAVGNNALMTNTASNNTAFGQNAGANNVTGSSNVFIGQAAGNNSTGNFNTMLGRSVGTSLTSGAGNIFVGYNVQPNVSTTASNQLNIGNWIYGNGGLIGLGTDAANPTQRLDVANGNLRVRDIVLPANVGDIATDKVVVAATDGVLKTVEIDNLSIEPWFNQDNVGQKATTNTQNIYQSGSVAIGKNAVQTGAALDVEGAVRGGVDEVLGTPAGPVGVNSVAFGEGNTASGQAAAAFGANNRATELYATAFGWNNTASAYTSTVFGDSNIASGINSTVWGSYNTSSGSYSTMFGTGNTSTADRATVFGELNIAGAADEIIFGRYAAITGGNPVNWVSSDPLLQIGNGSSLGRRNALTILKNGNIGTGSAIAPTESLDIGSGTIRVRDINGGTGDTATDNVVVADADGVLKTVAPSALAPTVTVNNGITKNATTSEIELGGTLNRATTITQNGNALAIATGGEDLIISGLDKTSVQATVNGATTTGITDHLLAVGADNTVKALKAAMPKFFFMPSIIIPTSEQQLDAVNSGKVTGDVFDDATLAGTINLYGRYQAQFGTTGTAAQPSSPGAPVLPVLPAAELNYYVTWYDTSVFTTVAVDANGIMTYVVDANADITVGSFMNIVFSVKED